MEPCRHCRNFFTNDWRPNQEDICRQNANDATTNVALDLASEPVNTPPDITHPELKAENASMEEEPTFDLNETEHENMSTLQEVALLFKTLRVEHNIA